MELKKFLSFVAAATVILCGFGCKFSNGVDAQNLKTDNEQTTKWSNFTQDRPQIAQRFDSIGVDHNKTLGELYDTLAEYKNTQARSVGKTGLTDEEIASVMNRFFFQNAVDGIIRAAEVNTVPEAETNIEFVFSSAAQSFIDQIKLLIDPITSATPQNEVEEVMKRIESIEKEAESILLPEEKAPFYAYTATSRASLAYWYDNIAKWDALRNTSEQTSRYISIWRRIAGAVASDAGGAYHGCLRGGELADKFAPGNSKVKLAAQIICGGVGAAWSSPEGWRRGTYVVVAPLDWLMAKIQHLL